MTAQDNFSELTDRINQAQVKVEAAARQGRDQLAAEVQQAQVSAEQKAEEIKAQAARSRDEAGAGWQTMKDKWQTHVAHLHDKTAGKKVELDQRKAGFRADAAEVYAENAIDFALAAVQEAEYAVLDAVLARADAEALPGAR
jgi:hypothetical protein